MSKNYVLYSTPESRENHTTSLLAIFETVFFVVLTWGIAYYFDTYIHIYIAIAIAPFLLLKTPESTKKALEWFLYEKSFYYDLFLIIIIMLLMEVIVGEAIAKMGIIIVVTIMLGTVTLIGIEDKIKSKFLKNIFLLFSSPILLIFGAIVGLFFLIKSIIVKFTITLFYTLKHPIHTFFNISKNWNEQINVNDIFYSPELLPKIHKKNDFFQLYSFVFNLHTKDLGTKILFLLISPIWSLSYLYRFSIKSTAWFFFPLAYLANLTALQDETKKAKAIKTQTWDRLFWFNLVIAAVLFLYFKFLEGYLKLLKLSEEQLNFIKTQVTNLREYFVPEAMWLLVVAVALYFIMNAFISQKEHLEEKNYGLFSFWIIRLIYSLWMVFLGWHIVVFSNHYVLPELPKLFGML